MEPSDRYAVISADCHAGVDLRDYRLFLESSLHDEFDRWADAYTNPFGDLVRPDADRNWDNAVRQRALEADGIVADNRTSWRSRGHRIIVSSQTWPRSGSWM